MSPPTPEEIRDLAQRIRHEDAWQAPAHRTWIGYMLAPLFNAIHQWWGTLRPGHLSTTGAGIAYVGPSAAWSSCVWRSTRRTAPATKRHSLYRRRGLAASCRCEWRTHRDTRSERDHDAEAQCLPRQTSCIGKRGRPMPGSFETIFELLVLPVGAPGPLDSFRDVQQNCAKQQRRADRADDEKGSDMGGDGHAFLWGGFVEREKPKKLGRDSNEQEQCSKPTS
jgi:hypothetical protein